MAGIVVRDAITQTIIAVRTWLSAVFMVS